jgi:hypothetical protein
MQARQSCLRITIHTRCDRTHRFLLLVRLIIGGSFAFTAAAQSPSPTTASRPAIEFDQFILVLLVRPANAPDFPKEELEKLQDGHMANMKALHAKGKLFKAGRLVPEFLKW